MATIKRREPAYILDIERRRHQSRKTQQVTEHDERYRIQLKSPRSGMESSDRYNLLYEVVLNFSTKKRGVRIGPNLKVDDLPASLPDVLTKRTVLEQVMKIYDPLGLVCPFTLWGKISLRELWSLKFDWDTPLPDNLTVKWIKFFTTMLQLEKL